eukprot:TRINITY_DN1397_c0_g1_i1.p1 TRINITY_DN1397_c0_g1~~TRINITY_DN1397_c0_g1_i1.p1  ORF type:complete len:142 (-),score=44.08 TRINITY_DN1397_c0_g1_i1:110-475(-)
MSRPKGFRFHLCDCCGRCESACFKSLCCPCCQFGTNYEKIEGYGYRKACCVWLGLGLLGNLAGVYGAIFRYQLRQKYNLDGNIVTDLAAHCCCCCCAIEQEAQEIKYQQKNEAKNTKAPKK